MAEPYTPLLARRSLLGMAVESVAGTAETVTAAMANTLVYDAKMEPVDWFGAGARRPHSGYLGQREAVLEKKLGRLTFRTEMRNADKFLSLLTGCGMVTAALVNTFSSDVSDQNTLTFVLWEDGRKKTLYGACGTCKVTIKSGDRVWAEWTFSGLFSSVADATLPSDPALGVGIVPYVATDITLTVGGATPPHCETVELDIGAQVEPRLDANAAAGVAHYLVTDRSPTLSLDPEARLVAQSDPFGDMADGTTVAIQFILDAGSGNTLTFAAPKAQYVAIADAERGGVRVDRASFNLCMSTGDDELTITEANAA